MRTFKMWSTLKLSTLYSDTRKGQFNVIDSLINTHKKAELCRLMKKIKQDTVARKTFPIQAGDGVVFHVGSKHTSYAYFREMRVLTHALLLGGNSHLNASCEEVIPFAIRSMQPEGSANMS